MWVHGMLGSFLIKKQLWTFSGDGNYKYIFKKYAGLNREEGKPCLSWSDSNSAV